MDRARCQGTNRDGGPCGGDPLKGGVYCAFHDPIRREKMAEGRRTGGRNRSNAERARAAMPQDVRSVAEMLLRAMTATEQGGMKPTTMTALAAGARAYAALYEAGVMLSRIERMESALDEEEVA